MAGKYKPYPAYKPPGVEWLADIPEGWMLLRGKYVFDEINERSMLGNETLLSVSEYYGVKPRSEAISEGEFLSRAVSLVGYKKCEVNDLAMNIMLAWKRGLGVSKFSGIVSPAYSVFRFRELANPKFMHYMLRTDAYVDHFKSRSTGVIDSRLRLYPDTFADIKILCPSTSEQAKIAAFLDHETAKIDALIAKQQRLIALLEEKRQAVISHAVTKGLNPNAPMRPSGIDWLGDMPAHWRTCQLKFQTSEMQTGPFGSQLHSGDYVSGGTPLINPAHIVKGTIHPDPNVSVDQATVKRLHRHKLQEGELVLARRGELGRCAVVAAQEAGWLCGTGSLKAALKSTLNPYYAFLLITSKGVTSDMSLESKGSTMENLNTETLGKIRLPIPPKNEQLDILLKVKSLASLYDGLVETVVAAGILLKERRTALISAAVTGKIDVRDWQPPKSVSNQPLEASEDAVA